MQSPLPNNSPLLQCYFMLPNGFAFNGYSWPYFTSEIVNYVEGKSEQENQNQASHSFAPTILLNPLSFEQTSSTSQCLKVKKNRISCQSETFQKDDEYRPEGSIAKKLKKSKQLQNRNVVPNIVRLIHSYIQKKGKSQRIVEQLFSKWEHSDSMNTKRFYLFQKLVRNKINNYVNEETLRQLCRLHSDEYDVYSQQEQRFYNKVTRTIIDHFLTQEIYMCVLTSKRMQKSKKRAHVQAIRVIAQKLRQVLQN